MSRPWWKRGRRHEQHSAAHAHPLLALRPGAGGAASCCGALVAFFLREPVNNWLEGDDSYDRSSLEEWLDESRGFRETLPEMAAGYAQQADELRRLKPPVAPTTPDPLLDQWERAMEVVAVKREEIHEHLRSLGIPPTKMYSGQLPLFPIIYRIEVVFDDAQNEPIVWDSELPYRPSQVQELRHPLPSAPASVHLFYQLHAYDKRQRGEQEHKQRLQQLSILAVVATVLVGIWIVLLRRRERQRSAGAATSGFSGAEIAGRGRRHEETERKLLEQRFATQAAEQNTLELKSQFYASIGIMAGSYAHNIKNLLVRPNDLLRRCLEADGLSSDQQGMLHEVQETLGTVTERLQQILRTVRRDPNRSERTVLDLNVVLRDLERTWRDLAPTAISSKSCWTWKPSPAVDRRRLFASATGGGESALQRPRRHFRDAKPVARRRPARRDFGRSGAGGRR